eukprot:2662273-Pyramimonas_sp.AAC.1
MGLDLVPISASAIAAAALVQKVRSRKGKKNDLAKPLSKEEREKLNKQKYQMYAKEELSKCWKYQGDKKKQVDEYFTMLGDPNWRLDAVRTPVVGGPDLEVWRLPGEKIHRIMGVTDVDATPDICMEYFKDTEKVFTKLFPKIDQMFKGGSVLKHITKSKVLCHAEFRMPSPVGSGSAAGLRNRDFVWEQTTDKLSTGNALVIARSTDKHDFPDKKGVVRGEVMVSGYYGRKIEGKNSSRVWYIVQADPKGFLPKWLVNLAAGKQADNVSRLGALFRGNQLPQL